MSTVPVVSTLRTSGLMRLAAVALLVVVWQAVVATVASESLPTPLEVAVELWQRAASAEAWGHVVTTSWRVAVATAAATAVGVLLGIAMGMDRRAEAFLVPPVVGALRVPRPVYIAMALPIIGLREDTTSLALTAVGVLLGIAMGVDRRAEAFLFPPVVVALGVPGPVYIIMAILIFGLGEVTTTLALIASVVPFVINVVYEGVQSRDRRLDQMAR